MSDLDKKARRAAKIKGYKAVWSKRKDGFILTCARTSKAFRGGHYGLEAKTVIALCALPDDHFLALKG